MKLDELKPAQKTKKRTVVGRGLLEEDIRDKKQEVAAELEEALKVVKLLYIEDYQKEDSTIAFMQTIM